MRLAFLLFFLFVEITIHAQSTTIDRNSECYRLYERYSLIIKHPTRGDGTALLPIGRLEVNSLLTKLNSIADSSQLTLVDKYNIVFLKNDNLPWSDSISTRSSRKLPFGFYENKANFYDHYGPDLKLIVNPGLNLQYGLLNNENKPLYTNTRSLEVRGVINNRLAFYSFISENQLRGAPQEKEYFSKYNVFPGAHYIKPFKGDGYDFFMASGYINFKILPSISLQFGQGRNFIGQGIRSLLLSDFATDYLYLKLNTQVWKINYQNLYAKLIDRYGAYVHPLPVKYMVSHYLGIGLLKNLNIGFYESVIFHDNRNTGRGYDLNYLNPIIFYRSVEHHLGDADKVMVGINSSWLPMKGLEVYGQLMVNEFRINDLRAGKGNANDKYGYQLGLKYINLFGIPNVDLTTEYNRVRPYSYAHRTIGDEPYPVNSYSHYNQPLAHPLGANFSELLVKVNAQPVPKILIEFNLIVAAYGADSAGSNWGQNIYLDYRTYEQELGNHPGQGVYTQLNILEAITSWQIKHNLFLELEFKYRQLNSELNERDSEYFYIGTALRLNLERRRWEY